MAWRIILPGERSSIDDVHRGSLTRYYECREGPGYSKNVGVAIQKVCSAFLVEPESLADSHGSMIPRGDAGTGKQVAFVERDCTWDSVKSRSQECGGHLHARVYYPGGHHYKILVFNGSSVEVVRRLNAWFAPVTSGSQGAGVVTLPDLGDMADRVGLTDFLKGGT
jgi:hypothetical protein